MSLQSVICRLFGHRTYRRSLSAIVYLRVIRVAIVDQCVRCDYTTASIEDIACDAGHYAEMELALSHRERAGQR